MTNSTTAPPIDARQASIVYQNQSHLAFAILKHNTKEGDSIDPREVIKLAKKLTLVALNPGLEQVLNEQSK